MPKAPKVTHAFRMSDEHRVKIQNSNILNALIEHAVGKRDMTATQVTAGIALLKKVLPDLQAVQVSGDPESPVHMVHTINLVAGVAAKVNDDGHD